MQNKILTVSLSPHIRGGFSVKKIMYYVVAALMPAFFLSIYVFGLNAAKLTLISIISCVFFELIFQKFILKIKPTISDGSAVITGILLAFNVPSSLPVFLIILGAFVSIVIAKMSFGGLGNNPFNPALIGRVFLLVSFPVSMTSWPEPFAWKNTGIDLITSATPLGIVKEGLKNNETVSLMFFKLPSYWDMFLGTIGGSIGETSALALLIGFLFLLYKKVISWHITLSMLGTIFFFTLILWLINPLKYLDPLFHILTGGVMLGAVFMATDMVTSPMSRNGMLVYGFFIGVLTVVIRIWGAYPEGVSFAILIMNAFVPLINKKFKPSKYGEKK